MLPMLVSGWSLYFFFNNPPPTAIYTLSLHDALPILFRAAARARPVPAHGRPDRSAASTGPGGRRQEVLALPPFAYPLRERYRDRKSTRLNSSHPSISYAVFCLKKKNKKIQTKNKREF